MIVARRDIVGAVIIVAVLIAIVVTLYLTSKPAGPAVGYEDNFFVQQRVRIQNKDQSK